MARIYFLIPTNKLTLEMVEASVVTNFQTIRFNVDGSKVVLKYNEGSDAIDSIEQTLGISQLDERACFEAMSTSEWSDEFGESWYVPTREVLENICLRLDDGTLRDRSELPARSQSSKVVIYD